MNESFIKISRTFVISRPGAVEGLAPGPLEILPEMHERAVHHNLT